MLDIQRPLERLFQYAPTSLERDYQHDMLLDATLGIVVDMVTPAAYALPEPGAAAVKLAPEDEALLAPEKETLAGKDRRGQRKKASAVPWLRKSEFITAVFDENLYNQSSAHQSDMVHAATTKSAKGSLDARTTFAHAGVEAVNRQFESANRSSAPLVHPRDPKLVATSVQYVLPTYQHLAAPLVHLLYEEKPAAELDGALERQQAMLVLNPFPGKSQEFWAARVLPDGRNEADAEVDALFGDGGGGGGGEEEEEAERLQREGLPHHWTGAYAMNSAKLSAKDGKYLFVWGSGGGQRDTLEYVPLRFKMELRDLSHDLRGQSVGRMAKRYRVARASDDVQLEDARQVAFNELFGEDNEDEEAANEDGVVPMQEGDDDDDDDEVDLRELEQAPSQQVEPESAAAVDAALQTEPEPEHQDQQDPDE